MKGIRKVTRASLAGLALAVTAACDSGTGPEGFQAVSLNFRVNSSAPASAGPARVSQASAAFGAPLVLSGSNGTLTINEIRVIINEVELHPDDGSCDTMEAAGHDCGEFEAPPRFLNLPLDGQPIAAVTAIIREGSYKELDFEIEDLEDDESDPVEAAAIAALRTQLLAQVPDWPAKASVLVAGSFAPTGGTEESFRVFIDAEIEVEMELVPRLVIGADGGANRDLTVDVAPHVWFVRADGSVLDLRRHDYDRTHHLLELEVELEHGFVEVEHRP